MTVGAQRPKVNEYNGDFFFVILPTFRLTKKSMDEWKKATKIKSDKILENDRNRTMYDPNEDSDNEEHEDDESDEESDDDLIEEKSNNETDCDGISDDINNLNLNVDSDDESI